ncbi:hypothetical protein GIB67_003525 [Kingdonia uniflora]|uniref:FHA domain-containing protein n=1 Tax=Kingdonia uniflora TaxID=39325 RepID=A0A7J7MEL6_9MAGN|nr:hypothetical protein GIB67_003525 [Kingdonia uniflora]
MCTHCLVEDDVWLPSPMFPDCCDVIINTDKGVSRIHAELIVDSMTSVDPLQKRSSIVSSGVCVKDCSKYGTFINKKFGSKGKVHEHPDKETNLKDGDLVSFGTGNATYRFCFVPFILFVYCPKPFQANRSIIETISSIGASAIHNWSLECTHVLVDDALPVKEDLIDAIVGQKPIVLNSWLQMVAEKSISTEIPSCTSFVPTMTLEGLPTKIVEPKVRENCLAAYTFLLGSLNMYKFGERLQSLLDVGGAKVLSVDEFSSSSQASQDGENNQVLLVIPTSSMNHLNLFQQLRSLSRVNEINLVSAVLSGQLDPAFVEPPSILVTSSCSTDETIVADSDVEMDTAATDHVAAHAGTEEAIKPEEKMDKSGVHEKVVVDIIQNSSFVDGFTIERRDKGDESDNLNSNIIYSQDLIVRYNNTSPSVHSTRAHGVVNFKCFRKKETWSGNSFKDFIPFSKYPYKESDDGNEEVAEHVREEKKRKQMEAIAEDLFNNDKGRRRGAAGSSLRELLTR